MFICYLLGPQVQFLNQFIIIIDIYQMRSGFVELIVKNRLAGKPIPITHAQKKYRPVDSFKKYLNNILPKLQESVEIQLLKKNLTKIASPLIRKQLVTAYLRRLFRLRSYELEEIKSYKQLPELTPEQVLTITDPTILKTINEVSDYDIGSYLMFSKQDYNNMFKHKPFGVYHKQYEQTDKFGVMIRRQSVAISSVMKLLQEGGKANWQQIYDMNPQARQQFVLNQTRYPVLFQQISNYIYEKTYQYRNKEWYLRVWGNSVISDVLTNSILQNIKKINDVFQMADQCIQYVIKIDIEPSALDFAKRFKTLPTTPELKIYNSLPYYCKFYYTTPSFKSVFLGGLGGTGRSMILTYLAMYGYKNNWIVLNVTDGYKWTNDRKAQPEKMYNGLYVIESHAVEWLSGFKQTNQHLIKDLKVKTDIYGKLDLTGVDPTQFQPVPNIYYQRRHTYFNDPEKKHKLKQSALEMDSRPKWRMTKILPNPVNVLDIVNAGIANPQYSTCAMGEILKQIYANDIPVVQLVDDYSWFFRRTLYRSFKYYNDNDLFGAIPAYHIAHCRMFVNLDGHKIKKGIKVVASSNHILWKHHFNIKMIMLPEQYEHRVPNLTPEQFEKAARYNILTEYWKADDNLRRYPQYMYTLCQGNWIDFERVATLGHYY